MKNKLIFILLISMRVLAQSDSNSAVNEFDELESIVNDMSAVNVNIVQCSDIELKYYVQWLNRLAAEANKRERLCKNLFHAFGDKFPDDLKLQWKATTMRIDYIIKDAKETVRAREIAAVRKFNKRVKDALSKYVLETLVETIKMFLETEYPLLFEIIQMLK